MKTPFTQKTIAAGVLRYGSRELFPMTLKKDQLIADVSDQSKPASKGQIGSHI
jgi:hypothetical protein